MTRNASGGSRVIAIVDAHHNPHARSDLQRFADLFGLPAAKLRIVFCNASRCGVSTPPEADIGWAGEIALDLEWAHAMAPSAELILVEANSAYWPDILRAEDKAGELVAAAGGGVVSNSFGGSEFAAEQRYDQHFRTPGVVYFASTGDFAGTQYPSVSPFVVAVGGTTILRDANGRFRGERAWYNYDFSSTGGGPSRFVAKPAYQNRVPILETRRGVPDIAADADPESGAYLCCEVCGGWGMVGGTSLASPLIAAMANKAGYFRPNSTSQLNVIYSGLDFPGSTTS